MQISIKRNSYAKPSVFYDITSQPLSYERTTVCLRKGKWYLFLGYGKNFANGKQLREITREAAIQIISCVKVYQQLGY